MDWFNYCLKFKKQYLFNAFWAIKHDFTLISYHLPLRLPTYLILINKKKNIKLGQKKNIIK